MRSLKLCVALLLLPMALLAAPDLTISGRLLFDNAGFSCDRCTITLLAGTSRAGWQYFPVGERLTIEGDNLGAMVLRRGRAARHHSFENDSGSAIARIHEVGIREGVGVPIVVDGRVWGLAIAATTRPEPMPADSEERIGDFAELVATALANAATRGELQASRDQLGELLRVLPA